MWLIKSTRARELDNFSRKREYNCKLDPLHNSFFVDFSSFFFLSFDAASYGNWGFYTSVAAVGTNTYLETKTISHPNKFDCI